MKTLSQLDRKILTALQKYPEGAKAAQIAKDLPGEDKEAIRQRIQRPSCPLTAGGFIEKAYRGVYSVIDKNATPEGFV
jgi:hypothetical protein